ncbi:hypothetical protein Fmac_028878 [Flemingia macrophylla]|uniref:Uncharacterized protein n=1 Tax=Flemingia macrophylla TaxID=520843 RepID=A0ABD1L8S0_9FABA
MTNFKTLVPNLTHLMPLLDVLPLQLIRSEWFSYLRRYASTSSDCQTMTKHLNLKGSSSNEPTPSVGYWLENMSDESDSKVETMDLLCQLDDILTYDALI